MESDFNHVLLHGFVIGIIVTFVLFVPLFAYSGVWPALSSVTSGSMEPNIGEGDIVLTKEPGRFEDSEAISTFNSASEKNFNKYGDVIIFNNNALDDTTILHRAMFEVETGENWYKKANTSAIPDEVDSCDDLANCPAPNSGYITKGDNNKIYDQSLERRDIVQPSDVVAEAVFSVPILGYIRILSPLGILGFGVLVCIWGFRRIVSSSTELL
jgi:signal peptidase